MTDDLGFIHSNLSQVIHQCGLGRVTAPAGQAMSHNVSYMWRTEIECT